MSSKAGLCHRINFTNTEGGSESLHGTKEQVFHVCATNSAQPGVWMVTPWRIPLLPTPWSSSWKLRL